MTESPGLRKAVLLAAACYAVAWVAFMVINASNMPLMDDYDAILGFLNNYSDAGPWHRTELLMERHNEHRIATARAVALLGYHLTGTANFTFLILAGAAFWCATLVYLFRDVCRASMPLVGLVLLPLFLSLRYATLFNWGMASLNHFTQLFFAVAAIHSLCRRRDERELHVPWVGLLALVCAAFSSGAGVLLLPLVIGQRLLSRQFRGLPTLLACCLAIVLVDRVVFPSEGAAPSLRAALRAPVEWGRFGLYFCGNLVGDPALAAALGLTAVALWGYAAVRRWDLRYPAAFYTATLQMMIGAAAATSRLQLGALYGLENKYSPYAIALWGSLVVMIASRVRDIPSLRDETRRNGFIAGLLCVATLCLMSWRDHKQGIMSVANINWIVYPDETRARSILVESQEKRIYDAARYVSNFRVPDTSESTSPAAATGL
jgi:hypothetical protein